MKVILFGATGMIGQGVLRECLLDPQVDKILSVVRTPSGKSDPKLRELVHQDFLDFSKVESELTGYDACFYCLGISSAGMKEAEYTRITYDFTLAAAKTLVAKNPGMTFSYISGASTDSTEQGSAMWARIKGKTENALLKLPFKAAVMFRPAMIRPMHGAKSKTKLYSALYAVLTPFYPLLARFPKFVTTTEQVGLAMLKVAKERAPKPILESVDIVALGKR